ncbi:Uncharacterised protein [Bordetella pertussis]|nr:Uncharacterised protein [Bordetella pertussis]
MEASISFWRTMRCCHQSVCSFLAFSLHFASASRGISHSCHCLPRVLFSASRNGSSTVWALSQMTSISALLAMDLRVMCGTRS